MREEVGELGFDLRPVEGRESFGFGEVRRFPWQLRLHAPEVHHAETGTFARLCPCSHGAWDECPIASTAAILVCSQRSFQNVERDIRAWA